MENQTGIYQIICKTTGKRYIGSTGVSFRKRWTCHLSALRRNKHSSIYLQNAWNKYGESNFLFLIIDIIPKDKCLKQEQMYFDTVDHSTLFNTIFTATIGGGMINKGRKLKPRTKQHADRISAALAAKPATAEQIARLKSYTDGQKGTKISESRLKKVEETKDKNRILRKGCSYHITSTIIIGLLKS